MADAYTNYLEAYNRYMAMVRGGVSPVQAIQDSGLAGLKQQQLKDEAGQAQKQGYAELGGQLVGALGTQYATGTGLFAPAAATAATTGAAAGTAAATGATTAGATTAGAGLGPTAMAAAPYVAAAVAAAYMGNRSFKKHGEGRSLSGALKSAAKDPLSYVGPGFLGAALGSIFGGDRAKYRNQQQTKHLLDIGFSQKQMQELGRMDNEGNIVFRPDTLSKEQKDAEARKWNEISRSDDPNVNPLRQASGIWGTEGMLSTYGPDYLNKMSEFDRYVAAASAIENGGGFYEKKGEVLLKNQNAAKAAYEAAKANPELMAKYQQNYDIYKSTGKDVGIPKIETPEEKAAKERAKQIYTSYND